MEASEALAEALAGLARKERRQARSRKRDRERMARLPRRTPHPSRWEAVLATCKRFGIDPADLAHETVTVEGTEYDRERLLAAIIVQQYGWWLPSLDTLEEWGRREYLAALCRVRGIPVEPTPMPWVEEVYRQAEAQRKASITRAATPPAVQARRQARRTATLARVRQRRTQEALLAKIRSRAPLSDEEADLAHRMGYWWPGKLEWARRRGLLRDQVDQPDQKGGEAQRTTAHE